MRGSLLRGRGGVELAVEGSGGSKGGVDRGAGIKQISGTRPGEGGKEAYTMR